MCITFKESSQPIENMFPRSDFMKQFKTASTNTPPSAVDCILNLVNTHLQVMLSEDIINQ